MGDGNAPADAGRTQRLAGEQRFQDRCRLEAQRRGGPPRDLIQELILVLGAQTDDDRRRA